MEQFVITWQDFEREPVCAPNPAYPEGIDLELSKAGQGCFTALPYPAKRCGLYHIHCTVCGRNISLTTAGRPDDPRSVTIPCSATRTA